jgi:hypothetical protein
LPLTDWGLWHAVTTAVMERRAEQAAERQRQRARLVVACRNACNTPFIAARPRSGSVQRMRSTRRSLPNFSACRTLVAPRFASRSPLLLVSALLRPLPSPPTHHLSHSCVCAPSRACTNGRADRPVVQRVGLRRCYLWQHEHLALRRRSPSRHGEGARTRTFVRVHARVTRAALLVARSIRERVC